VDDSFARGLVPFLGSQPQLGFGPFGFADLEDIPDFPHLGPHGGFDGPVAGRRSASSKWAMKKVVLRMICLDASLV
jgi:hypothetical protein